MSLPRIAVIVGGFSMIVLIIFIAIFLNRHGEALAFMAKVLWYSGGRNSEKPEVFRFRLTLNVSYNGKVYSDSSVIEARQYLFFGVNSAGSSGMTNGFSYRGTAPIVKLGEDGGWVFASVGARSRIQWLPWFIYEGTIHKGEMFKRKIVRMRANPPRIEIPFSDDRAKYLYELFYVPAGASGTQKALRILADGGKSERGGLEHRPRDPRIILPNQLTEKSNRDIKLVSFVIEKTDAPLVERVADVPGIELPPWDLLKKPPDRSGARVGPAPIIYRLSLETFR